MIAAALDVTALDRAIANLCEHGPTLFLGCTIVLAAGLLAARAQRTAAARRRLGIWTALASALYLAVAIVPLPRFGIAARTTGTGSAPAATPLAATTATPAEILDALGLTAATPVAAGHAAGAPPTASTPAIRPAAAAEAAPPRATGIGWDRVFATVWLAAAALLLARHIAGALQLSRLVRRATPAPARVAALADLPAGTRVLVADRSVRPFCAGWLRPIVVVSPELVARPEVLAAVLRHEAAHLAVRDPLVQRGLALLAVPLALHPLFWWLTTFVRFQSELCADQRAAGDAPTRYARELLDLVDDRAEPAPAGAASIAIFHRRSDFYRRIQMLLQPTNVPSRPLSRLRRAIQLGAMAVLVAAAAGTFGVEAAAQDPGQSRTERLAAERAVLENEIATLRAQIEDLRAALRSSQPAPAPGDTGAGTGSPPRSRRPGKVRVVGAVQAPPGEIPTEAEIPRMAPPPATGEGSTETARALLDAYVNGATPGTHAPMPYAQIPYLNHFFQQGTSQTVPASVTTAGTTDPEAIVALASRLLDLTMDIELAQAQIEESKALASRNMVPKSELARDVAKLRNLEQKRKIVRGLVDGEIRATESEVAWLSRSMGKADKHERLTWEIQLMRATARLEALRAAR